MRTRTYTLLQSDLPPAFQSFSFNFQVFRLKQGFCAITDVANEKEIQPASRPCLPACSRRRVFKFTHFNRPAYRRGSSPLRTVRDGESHQGRWTRIRRTLEWADPVKTVLGKTDRPDIRAGHT